EGKTQHGAERAAATEPVVHQDDPSRADHSAESESEIIPQAELARESGHLGHAAMPGVPREFSHCGRMLWGPARQVNALGLWKMVGPSGRQGTEQRAAQGHLAASWNSWNERRPFEAQGRQAAARQRKLTQEPGAVESGGSS